MPIAVSAEERQRIFACYESLHSYTEAAKALGMTRSKVIQNVRVYHGICVACPNPAEPGHILCSLCLAQLRDRSRSRFHEHLIAGLCGECGQEPLAPNSTQRGLKCLAKHAQRNIAIRHERLRQGLCATCGEPRSPESKQYCSKHLDILRQRALKDLSNKHFDGQRTPVMQRDGFRCRLCNNKGPRLNVHHVDGDKSNNDPANLITLCCRCHAALTNLYACFDPATIWQFFLDHPRS